MPECLPVAYAGGSKRERSWLTFDVADEFKNDPRNPNLKNKH
jgi:hypothetical protein